MATKTQIYKEILREYDRIRTQKMAEQRRKKAFAYEQSPRLEEIEQELSLLGVQAAKAVLLQTNQVSDVVEGLRQKQQVLLQEKRQLLANMGMAADALEQEYVCKSCQDTGYIGNTPCICLKQKVMDRLYDQSNVRDIVKVENFDSFDLRLYSDKVIPKEKMSPRENATNILRHGLAFVERFEKENGENLLLYGSTGLGKTFLCSCIAKELLEKGFVVLYLTAGQLFRKLEEIHFSHNEDEEQEEWDKELLEVDLLIIDDLGTEFSTVFTATELFRLLNDRKLRNKSVIISTNLNAKEITNQYSDRITSRLREYQVLRFFGEDIRFLKKYQ